MNVSEILSEMESKENIIIILFYYDSCVTFVLFILPFLSSVLRVDERMVCEFWANRDLPRSRYFHSLLLFHLCLSKG
jgi:hypothetical protein